MIADCRVRIVDFVQTEPEMQDEELKRRTKAYALRVIGWSNRFRTIARLM
jgi:hypothetical protein